MSEQEQRWRFHIDNYSEHYEVTNTGRERAEIGDGDLFRMGDRDDGDRLIKLLNALEEELRVLRGKAALADEEFGPEPWVDWGSFNIPGVDRIDCRWCHGRRPNHRAVCVKARYDALEGGQG